MQLGARRQHLAGCIPWLRRAPVKKGHAPNKYTEGELEQLQVLIDIHLPPAHNCRKRADR